MSEHTSNFNTGYNSGTISQVNNKTYNVTANSVEIKIRPADQDPLNGLYAYTAVGALHNSADRVDAPKCHEETRKAVQEDIFSWISSGANDRQPRQLLWVTGPAGSGKTAIMGTVSDKLKEEGQLVATFFFSSFAGPDRRSKRCFVGTLAYQLQLHPGLKGTIRTTMLSNIQQDPALFKMSLKQQIDILILQPLRDYQANRISGAVGGQPMVVVVDGVDECGEDRYESHGQSREKDQVEVLSVLLQAISDPAFPFRVIVASRPENWIRRFFTDSAAGSVAEIFLDNKYDPDKDIALFLKSKFAELSRRYGIPASTWPREEDMKKLVEDASGQFIYAATVARFVDAQPRLPQDQLDIVLKIRPPDGSSPFSALDALYTAILNSSSSAKDVVLWLRAIQLIGKGNSYPKPSAWTINRLFESGAGQARMLLTLPSLMYLAKMTNSPAPDYDFNYYNAQKGPDQIRPNGWDLGYSFYHKSFLDFLEDPVRCGASFPNVDDGTVERWVWQQLSRILLCNGPAVEIEVALLPTFKKCFASIWADELDGSHSSSTPSKALGTSLIHFCNACSSWSTSNVAPISHAARVASGGGQQYRNCRAKDGKPTTGALIDSCLIDYVSSVSGCSWKTKERKLPGPELLSGGWKGPGL